MTGPQPPYGDPGATPGAGGGWHPQEPQYGPGDQVGPGSYDQPQPYDPYEQPASYPEPYTAPPAPYQEPYSAPPGPYGDPHAMPPAPSSNPVPWIVGGIAVVIVLVLACVAGGAFLLIRDGHSTAGGGASGTDGGTAATYDAEKVSNACDVVDPTVLEKWAADEDEPPEHSESRNSYQSSFRCSARYKADGDDYSTASLDFSASLYGEDSSSGPRDAFDSMKESAEGRTGTGRDSGEVSGLGDGAFFTSHEDQTEYSSSMMYTLTVLDDNLMFSIGISVFLGEDGGEITKDDTAEVAEEQAKKVMEGFKA